MLRFFILMVLFSLSLFRSYSQDFNENSRLNFVNHTTPPSPEAYSFQRYGMIPVEEKTGIANIGIPLYTANSGKLTVPISLNYHPSGIRVNQEATWVGLGWDLNVGGRITLEVKGGYDPYVNQYLDENVKWALKFLINQKKDNIDYNSVINAIRACNWNNETMPVYQNSGILPCSYPNSTIDLDSLFDPIRSNYISDVRKIIKYGIGDPDLYHVSVMGRVFTFYQDLYTDSIRILNDQNLFKVEKINEPYVHFIITDDNGVKYTFSKEEKSYHFPYIENIFNSITTSWLLTSVIDLNENTVNFNYENFGMTFPAPAISESVTKNNINPTQNPLFTGNYSITSNRNLAGFHAVIQEPQFLTEIATKTTKVKFLLGNRIDISGDGNRKLEEILVTNIFNSDTIKRIKFTYDYFNSGSGGNYYIDTAISYFTLGTPSSLNNAKNHLSLRLKLQSIDVFQSDSTLADTHKFSYFDFPTLPNKVSLAQDHWGYFNGSNDMPSSVLANFTPSLESLTEEGIVHETVISPAQIIFGRANRKASEFFAKAFTLRKIEYPTGGSTEFEFELHKFFLSGSTKIFSGAGLRIQKVVQNYGIQQDSSNSMIYDYGQGGTYQGNLNYIKHIVVTVEVPTPSNLEMTNFRSHFDILGTIFSNGNLIEGGPYVLYNEVTQKFERGDYGKVIKQFNVAPPLDIHHKFEYQKAVLLPPFYIPPFNNFYFDGNLISETYYNPDNQIVKKKNFFYFQHVTSEQYVIKVEDDYYKHPNNFDLEINTDGSVYYLKPFYKRNSVLDSIVETDFFQGHATVRTTIFKYNKFYQNEFISTKNSKGEELIVHTRTPLSFDDVPTATIDLGEDAKALSFMRYFNVVNSPVEKLIIKKKSLGDSLVINAAYNSFDAFGNIKRNYLFENSIPVPINQFQRSFFNLSSNNLNKDSRYKINASYKYSGITDQSLLGNDQAGDLIVEINQRNNTNSYLYDSTTNLMTAVCLGGSYEHIGYNSFETESFGGWILNGNSIPDLSSPTGIKCYNLSSGSLEKFGLSSNISYILTYWTKNATPFSIIGTDGDPRLNDSKNGWNLYEHKISHVSSLSISGLGLIDEVRLFPSNSQMKNFTYNKIFQMVSETDFNGKITYYSYDAMNRLSTVKNDEGEILKLFRVKSSNQKVKFDGGYYLNSTISAQFTKTNCSSGFPQTAFYIVPEGKHKSLNSQSEADSLALVDLNENGQLYVNNNSGCQFFNTSTSITFYQNNCPAGTLGNSKTYSIPSGMFVSLISQSHANQIAANALAEITQTAQNEVNQGVCKELVTFYVEGSINESFNLEFIDETTNQHYYFEITSESNSVQVPVGIYTIRINPSAYSYPYNYVLNSNYYQSGEMVATFGNIQIEISNYNSIYIYE